MLIVIAHGSPKEAWRDSVEGLVRSLQEETGEDRVCLAYLEHGPPALDETLSEVIAAGATKVRILPLFLAGDGHVASDIRPLVDKARSRYGQVDLELLPAVGQHPLFRDLLLELIRQTGERDPAGPEKAR